jgi:hypothetical protein
MLPASYLKRCKDTGRKPITADYAVWLITVKHLRPAMVPSDFTTDHLEKIPPAERKRWLRVSRTRQNRQKAR